MTSLTLVRELTIADRLLGKMGVKEMKTKRSATNTAAS